MEAVFKKQFWVVTLMFLAANAYLLARGSNQFVAYLLVEKMNTTAANAAEARPATLSSQKGKPSRTLRDVDSSHNIFGAREENLDEGAALAAAAADAAAKKAAEDQSNVAPVLTAMRIKLLGVTWFENPEFSLASIMDLSNNETRLYSINACPPPPPPPGPPGEDGAPPPPPPLLRVPCNDLLTDGTITSIERDPPPRDERAIAGWRVVFFNKSTSRREFASTSDLKDIPVPPPSVASAPSAEGPDPSDNLGKGITKVGENQYKIPQADIDEVMANLNGVATQARIVPSFENGKPNGFKLFSIKPTSIFNKIGLQNGDVIGKINGYDMSSPDKALEVYNKIKDAKEISVEMNRRGQKQTMQYNIQ
jgi:general secretion pathway protein C